MPTDTPPPVVSPTPVEQAPKPSSRGILIAVGMIVLMCATAYLVYTHILSPSGKIYGSPTEFPQIKEGTLLTLKLAPAAGQDVCDPTLVAKIIDRRLAKQKIRGYSIAPDGPDRVVIQFPADAIIDEYTADSFFRQGKIELKPLHPNSDELIRNRAPHERVLEPDHTEFAQSDKDNKCLTPEGRVKKYETKETFVVSNTAVVTNEAIQRASIVPRPGSSHYDIMIELQPASSASLQKFTAAHQGTRLAIVEDGDVLSTPTINGTFGQVFQISVCLSQSAAAALAIRIENQLPCKLELGGMAPFTRNEEKASE